jgi:2-keto-3-deoxy-L-rhamnonate aldolase RhmA
VDAVFIGPYDLSTSLGKPGRIQDPDVLEAVRTVAAACGAKQVPVGLFSAGIPAAAKALKDGYTLVCAGIDIGLYSRSVAEIARGLKPINP